MVFEKYRVGLAHGLRAWLVVFVCSLVVFGSQIRAAETHAGSMPTIVLSGLSTDPLRISAWVIEGLALDTSPEQVLNLAPSAFKLHNQPHLYPLGSSTQTWFWFRVADGGAPTLQQWHLSVGKPFLDRATLHHRGAEGQWRSWSAGDFIANREWPVRSLSPQFVLPVLGIAPGDFLLSVHNNRPMMLAPTMQRGDVLSADAQLDFLRLGVFLGAVLLAIVISASFGIIYRDTRYVWYALYACLVFATVATYTGLGGRLFWPHSPEWLPHILTLTIAQVAVIVQLQFCRSMFLGERTHVLWSRISFGAIVFGCIAVLSFGINSVHWVATMFFVSIAVVSSVTFGIVLRAVRQGVLAAWLWLLAFSPLVIVFALTTSADLGVTHVDVLPKSAPMWAVMFEVLLLLVALHTHAKRTHASSVRSETLAQLDPLTGFVAAAQFDSSVEQAYRLSLTNRTCCSVVFVRVMPRLQGDTEPEDRRLKRVVRVLNTVCTESDTVVRVNTDVFALLMPNTTSDEGLSDRMSRLIALGLMDRGGATNKESLLFRIVGSLCAPNWGDWPIVRSEMLHRLMSDIGWDGRSIRVLRASELQNAASGAFQSVQGKLG